jgi:hypothetical protein
MTDAGYRSPEASNILGRVLNKPVGVRFERKRD